MASTSGYGSRSSFSSATDEPLDFSSKSVKTSKKADMRLNPYAAAVRSETGVGTSAISAEKLSTAMEQATIGVQCDLFGNAKKTTSVSTQTSEYFY